MSRARNWVLRATLLCSSLLGCSQKSVDDPAVAAAGSREAQTELRRLEAEWELRSGSARQALRPDLEQFVAQYRQDPSVPRARLLLGQIALMERRLDSAAEILEPILRGSPGPARDEAEVILAAIENRRGNHQAALDRLAPLEGKLLSREARDQYARERTNAAILARRFRLAVDSMIAWLAESDSSRHVKEWTEAAIVQVPTVALSRLLTDWDAHTQGADTKEASTWLKRVMVEHLSREALRSQDSHLARDLLERAPSWLRAGKSGDALSVLAALAQKEARIVGRGVGVVMGGATEDVQRRSARVGLGIVRGLDLGRTGTASGGIKVQVVENRGSTKNALGTLVGLGASILVAGFDADSASEAIAFAEARKVPVVVMHEPREGKRSGYSFLFGALRQAQIEAAEGAEGAQGRSLKWTVVGDGGTPCPAGTARPGTITLPWEEWRREGLGTVLVLADSICCSRVHSELTNASWVPQVIFGLEGADTKVMGGPTPLRLGVGQYPKLKSAEPLGQVSEQEQALGGQAGQRFQPGDWYYSLGIDLSRLLVEALRNFPETQVTDKEAVRVHHNKVRSALLDARAPLVTTDAQGFTSAGNIQRNLRILGPEGARK